jgi:hypothetical protein
MPPLRLTQEQQCKLVSEYFIIGEPLPRILGPGLMVDERMRCPPTAPALATGEAGLDPFGKVRRPFKRLPS